MATQTDELADLCHRVGDALGLLTSEGQVIPMEWAKNDRGWYGLASWQEGKVLIADLFLLAHQSGHDVRHRVVDLYLHECSHLLNKPGHHFCFAVTDFALRLRCDYLNDTHNWWLNQYWRMWKCARLYGLADMRELGSNFQPIGVNLDEKEWNRYGQRTGEVLAVGARLANSDLTPPQIAEAAARHWEKKMVQPRRPTLAPSNSPPRKTPWRWFKSRTKTAGA